MLAGGAWYESDVSRDVFADKFCACGLFRCSRSGPIRDSIGREHAAAYYHHRAEAKGGAAQSGAQARPAAVMVIGGSVLPSDAVSDRT